MRLVFERSPQLVEQYLECIADTVREFLAAEKLDLNQLKMIVPPQISANFLDRLAAALDVDRGRVVDVTRDGEDLFSSSTAHALRRIEEEKLAGQGGRGPDRQRRSRDPSRLRAVLFLAAITNLPSPECGRGAGGGLPQRSFMAPSVLSLGFIPLAPAKLVPYTERSYFRSSSRRNISGLKNLAIVD